MKPAKTTKPRRGRPPVDNPASAFISFRVTPEQRAAYERAAERKGMSMRAWAEKLLDGAAAREAAR